MNLPFNGKGELNASSLKDALQQIAKYAAAIEDNTPSNFALAGQPSLTNDERDSIVSRAIQTQEGKVALAQAMANPIR